MDESGSFRGRWKSWFILIVIWYSFQLSWSHLSFQGFSWKFTIIVMWFSKNAYGFFFSWPHTKFVKMCGTVSFNPLLVFACIRCYHQFQSQKRFQVGEIGQVQHSLHFRFLNLRLFLDLRVTVLLTRIIYRCET